MAIESIKVGSTMLVVFLILINFMSGCSSAGVAETRVLGGLQSKLETFLVFLRRPNGVNTEDLDKYYQSFLPSSTSGWRKGRLLHSYHHVTTGFAAKLTLEEAKVMEDKDGFIAARPQRVYPILTTHTPNFLGLFRDTGFWNLSSYGKGMIIGLLDTGVTPDHPSFSDIGMPPSPAKWKGTCEINSTICNNKIIGLRNFVNKSKPGIDDHGHGTHTASTAAGSPVEDVDFWGQLNGTASGIAPSAHLAMYKVCNGFGSCTESDILAGMDAAIEDGVDVLSLSLGGPSRPFYDDSIALGAFRAMEQGIFVSCAAGNSGPEAHSLSNEAPWILTVGASTVDRSVRATVQLGDKAEFDGQSFYQPKDFPPTLLPLVYAGALGNNGLSKYCLTGTLNQTAVKGKVVLCESGGSSSLGAGRAVKDAGGAAMIFMNDEEDGNTTSAAFHVLPAAHVTYEAGNQIKAYINSTSSPMATIIFKGTVYGIPYAPQIAFFSSRGPSMASPGILKPDIIGPGYQILAAWPISVDNKTNTNKVFNMISGTSMATPHLSGIAALLKSTHPDWSPAAIKSAILTTANTTNLGGQPISDQFFVPVDVFALGAGHVVPSKANDPGLVYDIQHEDYVPYLCGLGYTDKEVELIVQHPVKCSNETSIPEAQLNYPSFTIKLGSSPKTYTRTVTNVGPAKSTYTLKITAPNGVDVKVTPTSLSFSEANKKATYSVMFTRTESTDKPYVVGTLVWYSDSNVVRSPIVVMSA